MSPILPEARCTRHATSTHFCKEAVRGHYHVVRSVNEVSGSVKLCLIFTPFGTASCRREKENSSNQKAGLHERRPAICRDERVQFIDKVKLIRFVRKSSEGGELVTHLQNGGRGHVVVILAQVFQQVFHFSCGHGGTGNELQGLDEGLRFGEFVVAEGIVAEVRNGVVQIVDEAVPAANRSSSVLMTAI